MLQITEFTQRMENLRKKSKRVLVEAGFDLELGENDSQTIRLVFAGQYSAGKSSIIKMITGRKDIVVGAGITTQKTHVYEWKGLEVVDTPGIHTQLRPDHDAISYDAIASADMLVFVVTNELFDAHIAEHFRKLAIDKDKAGEMILVVNKMERAADGNSDNQCEIIRADLRKVLLPYTPEQLNLSFLDAESYLESIAETDEELADELVKRSRYYEFIDTLNRFVNDKRVSSKLTTELYLVYEQLDKAIKDLQPKSKDSDIDALEENLMQQRHLLTEARDGIRQEVIDIYTAAASEIRDIGLDSANLLVDGCKQGEVEEELERAILKADDIIETCQRQAINAVSKRLEATDQRLEAIENTQFSADLKSRLVGKFDQLPPGVQHILAEMGAGFQKAGQEILHSAYKAGVHGGLKLTNFAGSELHLTVKKIGNAIKGFKFKPWGAVKIARGIAVGGQVLSILGVGLTVFMQIKADYDDEKIREALRENRQRIRGQFNVVAKDLEKYGRQYIKENVDASLNHSISVIDNNIQRIRNSRDNRNELCRTIEDLQKEYRLLIQDIHSNADFSQSACD